MPKLLLTESIKNLGRVGDLVEVSSGYARNHLLPHHLAVEPTTGNLKKIELRRKEIEKAEADRLAQQAEIIKGLAGVEVMLERKANEQGHLFGSVSATDIAKSLQAQNFAVGADDILLPGKLDRIDTFMVKVKFAESLEAEVKVYIAPDADSKELILKTQKAAKEAAQAQAPAAE